MRATFEQLCALAVKTIARKWENVLHDHGWTLEEWQKACAAHMQQQRHRRKDDHAIDNLYRDHGGEG